MNKEALKKDTDELISVMEGKGHAEWTMGRLESLDFLRSISGEQSELYQMAKRYYKSARSSLKGFIDYLNIRLVNEVSLEPIEPKLTKDVVGEFLAQAETLLSSKDSHLSIPAMLIGATLENFLKTWLLNEGLSSEIERDSLDTYTKVLYEKGFIVKEHADKIKAWEGLLSSVAIGKVSKDGRAEVSHMLEDIKVLINTYTKVGSPK